MSSLTIDSMIDIKPNFVDYGGNKYFRRNAHKIALCSHGRKSDSVLATNYMQITAKVANRHLENVPIKVDGPIEVNWTEIDREELNQWGSLKFFGFDVEQASNFDQTLAEQQNLKLMCFWVNEGPLKKCLNNDANAVRNAMAAEGKDARIVSSILVAMETKLAEHFATHSNTSLTVSDMGNEILGITAGTGRVGSKTIQLGNDTTFAYGLYKAKWRNAKSEIKQLEDDWFSFG